MRRLPYRVVLLAFALAMSIGPSSGCVAHFSVTSRHEYNGPYVGENLNRVAFPLGGIGAGMVCLEGTGAISHVSVRHNLEFFNEPGTFAALCVRGPNGNTAKVLEGPVPPWKIFGAGGTANGAAGRTYGLPRFDYAEFLVRFPFGTVTLRDAEIPLEVEITGWSPFVPGAADDSSLPVGALEYRFKNNGTAPVEAVFSYHAPNFMAQGENGDAIQPTHGGFVLRQSEVAEHPEFDGAFAVFVDNENIVVDYCWFKGGWWDALTLAWRNVQEGRLAANPPQPGRAPGASLYAPLALRPGEERTIRVLFAWYVPRTTLRIGSEPEGPVGPTESCPTAKTHVPWYAGRFDSIDAVTTFWRGNYDRLRRESALFRDTFYDTTLPPEVVEAVAANLTILKSPTVLRQTDGRLWSFEGCSDNAGCCSGSCTHVWNYAQAIPHLFPDLERTLRETEFQVSQDDRGHQTFRASLPIRPVTHTFHAAADGQLGGIMKVYREWRISGDAAWLRAIWPQVRQSLDYCIRTWDPREHGVLEEPHHNTYDIEYWGPDGHCSSFYLGALTAAIEIGRFLGDDVARYKELRGKGRRFLQDRLYNGEYFRQLVQTEGLNATFTPLDASANGPGYAAIIAALNTQGPKYQYGNGCLLDGVLGFWMARVCGLEQEIVDPAKIQSSLEAIYRYNLRRDLSDHANPQRPSFALGHEGGLLLCTWPHNDAPALPFVYSDEVWTGIEYQVASHLMLMGLTDKGLEIVRVCRDRYDGRVRNPFDEYECGHWYARALSSYALLQGITGVRYDAVDRTLFFDSPARTDFRSFLATATGFGTVGMKHGQPFLDVTHGQIDVQNVVVRGRLAKLGH